MERIVCVRLLVYAVLEPLVVCTRQSYSVSKADRKEVSLIRLQLLATSSSFDSLTVEVHTCCHCTCERTQFVQAMASR